MFVVALLATVLLDVDLGLMAAVVFGLITIVARSQRLVILRPSKGFGEQGKRGFYFRGTWEQRSYFEGNRGTKTTIFTKGNIRKQIFDFLGTGEQANLFQGNKGTGTPLWEGLNIRNNQYHLYLQNTLAYISGKTKS